MSRILQGLMLVAGVTLLLGAFPNQSHAVGTHKFCTNWRYNWTDEPGNQDHLGHAAGGTGTQPARFAFYNVFRNGTVVSTGYADSSGCFTTPGHYANYRIRLYPQIKSGTKTFSVFMTSAEQWEPMDWTGTLNQVADGITVATSYTMGSISGVANVAAVASNLMHRATAMGLKDNKNYKAYANQDCPKVTGDPNEPLVAACANPAVVFLGSGGGARRVFQKHVVGHEIGHHIGYHLAAGPNSVDYSADGCNGGYWGMTDTCTLPQECRCTPHVVSANSLHCLQSREYAGDAAQEGWAHFYATAIFNEGSNAGSFTYYKEFWTYGGTINPPLLNYEVSTTPVTWLELFCMGVPIPAGNQTRGTQLDWQYFFYNLHRLSAANNYSLDDIARVYANATNGGSATWAQLVTSAATQFPGAKGTRWQTLGASFGVDH